MMIRVKMFAVLRERAGMGEFDLDVEPPARVSSAIEQVAQRFPSIRPMLAQAAAAVNRSYASRDAALREGDELALIPPVSGGRDG